MKKIEINIKYPYKKYFAFKSLRSNVEMVFPKLEIGDNDSVISTINRIDDIMHNTEYYKRGDMHSRFDCAYHWQQLPDRFQAERIEIQSITGKEVGTITIK
ncbi:MAG: hypothetical protein IKQ70_00255 [Bacteroidales bacterium]|nr:hypothetical protein [Bacteroidales bacterium]MBR6176295.1 hypothetical protein [Bacteroidales bacterium]